MVRRRILVVLAAILTGLGAPAPSHARDVMVFAAASLANAADEVGQAFAAKGMGRVRFSFAASSALARQIENGAPADLFISADQDWMDHLAGKGLIALETRRILLGNALVLVAPADAGMRPVRIERGTSIAGLAGDGRIATGDPGHVPVGKYARQALEALGQWAEIEAKLARMDSVRAALALVERGEAPLGIVYATDAAASAKIKLVAVFPDALHAPIVYPAALVAGREDPAARAFLAFLASPEARAIWVRHGFRVN